MGYGMMKRKLIPRVRDFFTIILRDQRRKNLTKLLFEYSGYLLANRALAEQYFTKFLYRKEVQNHENFIVTRKLTDLIWRMNDRKYSSVVENKRLFELFFASKNISIVKSLAYNINSLFFFRDEVLQLNTAGDLQKFLLKLLESSEKGRGIFIKKNQDSCGGKNVIRLSAEDILNNTGDYESVFKNLISSEYIFQEILIQHEKLNKLNPYCINTLRLDTFTNKNSETKILSGFLRLGISKGIVDNVSSGGVYVPVRPGEGVLQAEGYTDFTHGKGRTYQRHPLTREVFEGFKLPFYEEAERLVVEAAQKVPQLKIIGWDVAFLPDGPVLLEGNVNPGLNFSEIGEKGFRKNPIFIEMLKEVTDQQNQ